MGLLLFPLVLDRKWERSRMQMRVLAATDLSEASDEALRQAHAHAKATGAELAVCHVLSHVNAVHALFPQKHEAEATDAVAMQAAAGNAVAERIAAVTGEAGIHVFVEQGSEYAEIVRRAETWGARLIVVGSQGRTGLARLFLGSVAERVVRYAHCPVLVARPSLLRGPVVVATDLSDPSLPAVAAGAEEAKRRGARLVVIHALDYSEAFRAVGTTPFGMAPQVASVELQKQLRDAAVSKLRETLSSSGVEAELRVEEGPAAALIVSTAGTLGAELIVVGTRGRTGLSRIALGSVAERIVRAAECSFLAVRLPHD